MSCHGLSAVLSRDDAFQGAQHLVCAIVTLGGLRPSFWVLSKWLSSDIPHQLMPDPWVPSTSLRLPQLLISSWKCPASCSPCWGLDSFNPQCPGFGQVNVLRGLFVFLLLRAWNSCKSRRVCQLYHPIVNYLNYEYTAR